MLDTLKAALAVLAERDTQLTERWQLAQAALDHAKHEERAACVAMENNTDLREQLDRFIKSLEAEGQK